MGQKPKLVDFKISFENNSQFMKAWDLLIGLGYSREEKPVTCPYFYCYSDGRIELDYFDVEGADLSSPSTAFHYFTNHKNPELTFEELQLYAQIHEFFTHAPEGAWVWERFPNGRCLWHCRIGERSFDRKAPDFDTKRNTLWLDPIKQKESDQRQNPLIPLAEAILKHGREQV